MKRDHDSSYVRFGVAQSAQTKATIKGLPSPAEAQARFARLARESIEEQKAIEAADEEPFESFRQKYVSPEMLRA